MKRSLALLLILLMLSMPATGQGLTLPVKPASAPAAKLYTEAEAEAAIDAAVDAAVDAVVASKAETIADLKAALIVEAGEARKARAWTTGVVIGGAVFISFAFVAGAWIGIKLSK